MPRFPAVRPLLALALLVTACAPATPTAPTGGTAGNQTPQLAEQQRLVIGFLSVPASMDPHTNAGGTIRKYDIFEPLVILSDDGREVRPLLATSWQNVDATTWRFTLRTDARWHDGTPVTAEDVAFSWARVTRPGFRSQVPGNVTLVQSMTAIDPRTVEIRTRAPNPLLLRQLAEFAIVPKAYVERVGDAEFTARPIGSGPFQFVEYRNEDRVVVRGWMEHAYRRPTLQEVVIRAIPDANARATGIRLGELDVAFPIGFESGEALRRESNITVNANQGGIIGTLLDPWGVDGTNVGPIQDRRVRQAINYAVDRETLARTIYRGLAEPAGIPVRAGVFGANPDIRPYTFDRNRARQLLAEAGYPNGFRIQMEVLIVSTEINNIALYLQDQLRQVGIEMEIQPVDAATFVDKIYKRRPIAPIYLGGLGTATDADSVLRWFWSENTAFGKRYNNPEFDRLYVQSTTEMDPTRREAMLRQLVQIIQDDPPWMGLVVSTSLLARLNTVDGLVPRSFENDFFLLERVRRIR